MEQELKDRFEEIEKKLSNSEKDIWDKLQALSGILIPLVIAGVGWFYTSENSKNELEIQRLNNENQFQVAVINSNVGQSGLIKDFMQHLTGTDSASRNIAIEAILYAAPAPGKKIVEVLAKSRDNKTRSFAIDALATKRMDLIGNLFSEQKQLRLIAANEIITNWTNDSQLLNGLLNRTKSCLVNNDQSSNCEDGVLNSFAVMHSFSKQLLLANKLTIDNLANKIASADVQTKKMAEKLIKKMK